MPSRTPRRTAATAAASREGLLAALREIDLPELLTDQVRVLVQHLARAGYGKDDIAEFFGEQVNRWVDQVCEGSQQRLVRRCGDNIGDVAKSVTKHVIKQKLPS